MHSRSISRRQTLGALGASGVLALAGCVGDDDNGDDTEPTNGTTNGEDYDGLRVGILGALTGSNGPEFGHQGITGFLCGLAYKADAEPFTDPALEIGDDGNFVAAPESIHGEVTEYSVGDVDFELHFRDSEDDARTAERQATRLVNDENVDVLYGLSNSDSLLRVINNVVEVADTPLFVGQATTSEATADAETCDRRVFRATETSAMSARVGARYIVEQDDLQRVALFGADYSFGRSIIRQYRTALEAEGVEIVTEEGEEIFPQGYTDWQDELAAVDAAGVDVIVYGFTAQTGIPFFREWTTDEDGDVSIPASKVIGDLPPRISTAEIGSSIQGILDDLGGQFEGVELESVLQLVDFGPLTGRYMWNQYDNEINDTFYDLHTSAYNVPPDLFTSSSFTSASAIVQALEAEGEVSADAVLEGAYGMQVEDTPKGSGEYVFQEYNNQARSPMTMAGFVDTEDAYWPPIIQASEPVFRLDKDETTLQEGEVGCSLEP